MRRSALIVLLFLSRSGIAQDWALLNPAYKYNYSNDGSDTISNQIEVVQMDTLGIDSVYFTLGLRMAYCDTCLNGTGGVSGCDGCYLWDNAPEFLGRSCRFDPGGWTFLGIDTMVIRSSDGLGSVWDHSPDGTLATVIMVDTATVLGTLDSVKYIATSALDTIFIGKQHGIIQFRRAGQEAMILIGVEGLGAGIVRPSLEEFFPYEPGDVLEYVAYQGGIDGIGGGYGGSILFKMAIQGVEVADSAVNLAVQSLCSFSTFDLGWPPPCGICGVDTFHLSFDEIPHWGIMWSRPGELMAPPSIGCLGDEWAVPKHYRDSSGHYHISTSVKPSNYWPDQLPAFHYLEPTSIPHLFAFWPSDDGTWAFVVDTTYGLHYVSGIGFMSFKLNQFESWQGYVLQGAVIGGDTIGTVHTDLEMLAPELEGSDEPKLFPDPADELIYLDGLAVNSHWSILDLTGKQLARGVVRSTPEAIDLTGLPDGMYFLHVHGARPWIGRFIIAR